MRNLIISMFAVNSDVSLLEILNHKMFHQGISRCCNHGGLLTCVHCIFPATGGKQFKRSLEDFATHVLWCMPGSLTSDLLWPLKSVSGKTLPAIPAHAQPANFGIWWEAHSEHYFFMAIHVFDKYWELEGATKRSLKYRVTIQRYKTISPLFRDGV